MLRCLSVAALLVVVAVVMIRGSNEQPTDLADVSRVFEMPVATRSSQSNYLLTGLVLASEEMPVVIDYPQAVLYAGSPDGDFKVIKGKALEEPPGFFELMGYNVPIIGFEINEIDGSGTHMAVMAVEQHGRNTVYLKYFVDGQQHMNSVATFATTANDGMWAADVPIACFRGPLKAKLEGSPFDENWKETGEVAKLMANTVVATTGGREGDPKVSRFLSSLPKELEFVAEVVVHDGGEEVFSTQVRLEDPC